MYFFNTLQDERVNMSKYKTERSSNYVVLILRVEKRYTFWIPMTHDSIAHKLKKVLHSLNSTTILYYNVFYQTLISSNLISLAWRQFWISYWALLHLIDIWQIKKYNWSREVTWAEEKSSCLPPDVMSHGIALCPITSLLMWRHSMGFFHHVSLALEIRMNS